MSKEIRHLKNAPITEAVLDIQYQLSKDFDLKSLKSFYKSIQDDYPEVLDISFKEANIKIDKDKQTVETKEAIIGYRCVSVDKTKIIQLKKNGFTFSKLRPYTQWKDLRDEAKRIWDLFLNEVSLDIISRVALRYINNLNIPPPFTMFSNYLESPPSVPEGLPQNISSYLYRIVIPNKENGFNAIITQALENIVDVKKNIPILLDIDVYKKDQDGFLVDDIWKILEEIRDYKNLIFFNMITNELLEVYK